MSAGFSVENLQTFSDRMDYVGFIPFVGFAVAELILSMDMKASVKRKAFRWCVILSALSFLIVLPLTGLEIELLVFVIPALAGMSFISIRYTKICEWCATAVRTNLPFVDKEHCLKCGSAIK